MDKETIDIYNQDAENIAQLHSTLIPHRVYELIQQYFIKNTATLDIGCGIGRDTQWLNKQGFLTLGVDASAGMLKQARQLYPDLLFNEDYLPELASHITLATKTTNMNIILPYKKHRKSLL